jgi:hypothetical protein
MKNPRLHFMLSALTGLCAAAAPLRAANVLYFRDAPIGPDRLAEALGALGHNVTLATNSDDFQAQIGSGDYDLGAIFVQTQPAAKYSSAITALSTFVNAGGRALYADWSRDAALAAGFGAGFTGSGGERSATVVSLEPGNTLVPSPIKLRNTGWFHAANGLTALNGGTVAASFATGAPAIVRGSSGRSLVFGFLGDTPHTAAIFARGAEAVLAPTFQPVIAHDHATPSLHSVDLHGFVVPTNAATEVSVEYGLTATYGSESTAQFIPGGYVPVPIKMTIEGLAPHTTYHYRFHGSNLAGESSSADLTFTTLNTPPIVNDDHLVADAFIPHATYPFTIRPLQNDTDADGDALSIDSVTQGEFGSVTFDSGTVTYTAPYAGLRGDSFTYTVSDGFGGSATATVFIEVSLPYFRGDYTSLLRGYLGAGDLVGRLTLTLGAGGAFTGQLMFQGRSVPVMGVFGANGNAHFTREQPGSNSLVFNLNLIFGSGRPVMSVLISDGISSWFGEEAVSSRLDPPLAARGGRYTLATVDSQFLGVPRGEAWAVFAGAPDGRLRLVGRFADGRSFSGDTRVESRAWPRDSMALYLLRQTPPIEALAGRLFFAGDGFRELEGSLLWTRFPTQNDPGFSWFSLVRGGRYHPPPEHETILEFPAIAARRARARLYSDFPGSPWSQMFYVKADGLFPLDPRNDRITLQFSRSTGKFTGSFDHPTRGRCRVSGVLLQQENLVRGSFSGNGISGGFRLIPR